MLVFVCACVVCLYARMLVFRYVYTVLVRASWYLSRCGGFDSLFLAYV